MAAVIDALPYYDAQPTDEELDAVDLLIEAELPNKQPLHQSLADKSADWQPKSKLMQQELARVAKGEKLQAIDLKRYQDLQVTDETTDLSAALQRNIVAAEIIKMRLDNLGLLRQFGPNAWLMHVFTLEEQLKAIERSLQATRNETEQLNAQRKRIQVKAGERLDELTDKWRKMVSSNLELGVACAVLEEEVAALEAAQDTR